MTAPRTVETLAVVIPLKRIADAKRRLREGGTPDVDALVRTLARGVIDAARPRPTIIVTEDDDVADFAASLGVEALRTTARTLSDAVQFAYAALGERFERLTIAHADLASPAGLGEYAPRPGITLVADHHGRGTTVMSLETGLDFHFAYGANSLTRHLQEARRLEVDVTVIMDSTWSRDVDEPADLESFRWS